MQKIPTAFNRDWSGDRSRVIDAHHKDCEWVFAGHGVATRKLDGTSCLVLDGLLLKRRELREGDAVPSDFELATHDEETGKRVGWVRVGDGPEDRWHREAFRPRMHDGTYELVGPKIQGNPEGYAQHLLISHGDAALVFDTDPPRTFDGLRAWLSDKDIEGIVWHHADGQMAKIKLRDFGLNRERIIRSMTPEAASSMMMHADTINLRSIAKHERDHCGRGELAMIIEIAADEIEWLRAERLPICSAHHTFDPECRMCSPLVWRDKRIAELEAIIATQKGRGEEPRP